MRSALLAAVLTTLSSVAMASEWVVVDHVATPEAPYGITPSNIVIDRSGAIYVGGTAWNDTDNALVRKSADQGKTWLELDHLADSSIADFKAGHDGKLYQLLSQYRGTSLRIRQGTADGNTWKTTGYFSIAYSEFYRTK